MDLLVCPYCARRFVIPTGDPPGERRCLACGRVLELKVRSIPGRQDLVAEALDAELLDPRSGDGAGSSVRHRAEADR